MLQSLFIENFVLIDHLEIDFHQRMSVFTGETGAGKSIIIGALSMALGARGDTQVIGPFANQTEVVAQFDISNNPAAQQWLTEQDLLQGDELLIRRTLNQQGRSKQWINGRPIASGSVRELSQSLLQIHGQHDQIKLLNSHNQLLILDHSAAYDELLRTVATACQQVNDIEQQRTQLISAGSLSAEQLQLLQYQFDELEQLQLQANEYEQLHQALKTASHAQDLTSAIDQSMQTLSDDNNGAQQQLTHTISLLQQTPGMDFSEVIRMLDEAAINVSEASSELQQAASRIDNDPAELASIETRLEQINHIARKQQVMPELLYEHHQNLSVTLQQHADLTTEQQQLDEQQTAALAAYRKASQQLSVARNKAAQKLAKNITRMIQDLGLPEAQFDVLLTHQAEAKPKPLGNDQVAFMIAANKGQKSQPLNKTASGGELSRISLAIEVCTQQPGHHQAFVFDEVDTGIGGATAEKVGAIMQQLSVGNQVFCVTHLPQVAGHAHDHLLVKKSTQGQYTTSTLVHLTEAQRIQELARMAGGQNITEATLAQAKEFLKTG